MHREPKTWKWQDRPKDYDFDVIEPTGIHTNVVLYLSLNATIDNSRITKVLGEDTSIWAITIPSPNNDFLKGEDQLSRFRILIMVIAPVLIIEVY